MRIVVTGGAGFIGTAVCCKLLAAGHPVTVLDSLASGARGERNLERLTRLGAASACGDIRDPMAVQAALTRADAEAVVHLAAVASVPASVADPEGCFAVNVEGTRQVLAAARDVGARRFVLASTASLYGPSPRLPSSETDPLEPASPYAHSKLAAEELCRTFAAEGGIEPVLFRFFNVYGPGQDPASSYSGVITRWVDALRETGQVDLYGDGRQTRDFVHVEDVARAICLGLERDAAPPTPLNIGSGVSVSLLELLETLGQALGVQPKVRFLPGRAGDVRHSRADIYRAGQFLGYTPSVDLATGIRELVEASG